MTRLSLINILVFVIFSCSQEPHQNRLSHGTQQQEKEDGFNIYHGDGASDFVSASTVRLLLHKGSNRYSRCSGSVIGDHHILTAAHCITEQVERIYIQFADVNPNTVQEIQNFSKISTEWYSHPDYKGDWDNDIAIVVSSDKLTGIRLNLPDRSVTTTAFPLVEASQSVVNVEAIIAGYGKTEKSSQAWGLLEGRYRTSYLEDGSIHINVSAGGVSHCSGDSGGPLLINKQLAGVIKGRVGDRCNERSINVSTDVKSKMDWINGIVPNSKPTGPTIDSSSTIDTQDQGVLILGPNQYIYINNNKCIDGYCLYLQSDRNLRLVTPNGEKAYLNHNGYQDMLLPPLEVPNDTRLYMQNDGNLCFISKYAASTCFGAIGERSKLEVNEGWLRVKSMESDSIKNIIKLP